MKFTKESYIKAEQQLALRRDKAEREYRERMAKIKVQAPEIANMTEQLKSLNIEMVKLIGSGRKKNAAKSIYEIKEKNLALRAAIANMLKEFGYPEDYLKPHYHCSKCMDRGFTDGIRCECMTKLLELYTSQDINKNCSIKLHSFNEFKLEYYPESDGNKNPREKMFTVFNDCKSYAENFSKHSPSLFFFGGTGLGKTFLSSCIANELLHEGRNIVFCSLPDILRQINDETFGKTQGSTAEILKNAELVILDDLGSEFKTSFNDSAFYEIINYRLNGEKPTIISTNLSVGELNSRYNERIVSRIIGSFLPFMFLGNDIRPIKRAEKLSNFK